MKALDLSKVDSIAGAPPNIDTSLRTLSNQNLNFERPTCQISLESSEHNIEDVDHASHMDEDSKLDGDIASNSRSRVSSFSCLNELSISSGNVLDKTPNE